MDRARSLAVIGVFVTAMAFPPRDVAAVPDGLAEKSLDKCQKAIRTEGAKYVQQAQKVLGACLGEIASEVLKKSSASVAAAVPVCTSQFEKLARTDGKSVGDVFTAKTSARCEPAPANAHSLNDLLGSGFPGVAEPIDAQDVSSLCRRFGVTVVDSVDEWIDCLAGAHACAAHDAIAAQFPRAVEWLGELADEMPPSPARDAVLASRAAIDGTLQNGFADGGCSVEIPAAGCSAALFDRDPHQVVEDLHEARAAGDWGAVACNYHPSAFVIDDQGVLVGPAEIVANLESLDDLAGGVQPVVHEDNSFDGLVRVLFTLDAGWWEIEDGTSTYVVRRGRIVQQTNHGLIRFTGPPPDDT